MIGSTVVDEVSDRQTKAVKIEKRKEIAANATIANDDGIDPFTPLPDPTLDGELRNLRHTDSTTYALSEMNARQMRLKALEPANIRAQIKNRPPTATEELILKADAQSVGETYSFSNAATPLEKVAAFGATIPLIPESIAGALGAVATRTLIGPVSEALVLDTLGGQVLTQTIGRAGVAMGESKFLNKWGLFGGEKAANFATRRAYLNDKFGRVGNLNYDINFRGYASEVDSLNISTGTDKAVFCSGRANAKEATKFAKSTGRTTLELTPGGKYLNAEHLYERMTAEQADSIWGALSKDYAFNASGEVHTFVKGGNPFRIFNQVELPILQNNPNVSAIISEIDYESAINNSNRFRPRY